MIARRIEKPPENVAGYNPLRTAGNCQWDGLAAARAVDFFPTMLRHVEGKCAGQPFVLEQWQADYVATLFGWKRPNGTRRYRESLAAIPRKNGKTTLGAGIALYALACDGEAGAQVYSAAYSRDQASLVFAPASAMVKGSPHLSKRLKPIDSVKRITYQQTGSFYRAIPADAAGSHGFNAHAVVFDELHTQRDRELYDVLRSSQGARTQPLFLSITTAGYDRHSICYELWHLARQIRDGVLDNPYFLPLIYELPEGEDWGDESLWSACNPNLGVSVGWEFLREEYRRAKDSPAYENTFRNLYLNQWVEQAVRWLSMEKWALGNEALPAMTGRPCWVAIDLSSTRDITAMVAAFPRDDGGFYLLPSFWVPGESARGRERMDGVPYVQWASNGLVEMTDGDSIDQEAIRRAVHVWGQQYDIQEIAVDPWNGKPFMQKLAEDGFEVVEHRQGFGSMANPTKEFDRLVFAGKIQHGNNPVLRWMAGNVAVEIDAHENMKPSKKRSTERIDGIVAAVMAVGRASTAVDTTSIYETRGLVAAGESEPSGQEQPQDHNWFTTSDWDRDD